MSLFLQMGWNIVSDFNDADLKDRDSSDTKGARFNSDTHQSREDFDHDVMLIECSLRLDVSNLL